MRCVDGKPTPHRSAHRRDFFKTGAAAAAGWAVGTSPARAEGTASGRLGNGVFLEAERSIPIVAEADVVVCGGGPAGVSAAVAAARAGAGTRLIEANGCIGGIWTGGLLSYLLDYGNKPGIMQEILARLREREEDARRAPNMYDPEAMKLVLEEMCLEAGVGIQLHTQCAAAVRNGADRLALVVTESKSGREAVAGKVFIDCTGDGDVAHEAGCGWDYGRPEVGDAQPMSFIVLIPYRSLVAADVDGLMMAGRCISGDFYAHSAYRVTGNAVAMGEAAGFAAATAVKNNVLPHEVDWAELRKAAPWAERT